MLLEEILLNDLIRFRWPCRTGFAELVGGDLVDDQVVLVFDGLEQFGVSGWSTGRTAVSVRLAMTSGFPVSGVAPGR